MNKSAIIKRCSWSEGDALYEQYHDREWGTPCHDDNKLFEMIILESFQAGLSWRTVLYKRENFRKAFKNFNAAQMAKFREKEIQKLLADPGIIRNRLKIEAAVNNAARFLEIKNKYGKFAKYIWQFAPEKSPKRYSIKSLPAKTKESDMMSKDMKEKGFKFIGSTTSYAFMQSVGMVNDHIKGCFKFIN